MKDAAPKVFRSLERQGGPHLDDVVAAAVSAFAALRRPTPRQCDDLAKLVLPLWDRVSADALRNAAAALSHSDRVPRALVERFAAAPVEVAAPFLVSSPLLTEEDVARLARSDDERLRRLAVGRTGRAASSVPAPAPAVPARATAPTRPEIAAPPLVPFELAGPAEPEPAPERRPAPTEGEAIVASAAGVRETLRRLVLGSRAAARRLEPADLLAAAMERDADLFADRLAAMLELDGAMRARIMEDATGERLAVALRALDLRQADALSILILLKPRIGLDVAAFDAIARYYAQLQPSDCRRLVGGNAARSASAPPVPAPRALPAPRARIEPIAQPRTSFGRRAERPVGRGNAG